MCVRFIRKNRSCWKELDENIIYYENDMNYDRQAKELRFLNVASGQILEYFKLAPKSLGLLNKQNSYLNIFIETKSSTVLAKLYQNPLQIKLTYRICQEYLFYSGPIYELSHNILLILQNRRLVQLSRNKLIRKYKGKFEPQINSQISVRMKLSSFNLFRNQCPFFFNQLQINFERTFNISLFKIDQQYGTHIFKKIGNFIILKKQYKFSNSTFEQKQYELPVYYVSIDVFHKGDGFKGKIFVGKGKTLKILKQFHNRLYAVISFENQYLVHEIINGHLMLLYSVSRGGNIKKPILQLSRLIATNKKDYFDPTIFILDLQRNELKKQ